jgi:hypothetical protein
LILINTGFRVLRYMAHKKDSRRRVMTDTSAHLYPRVEAVLDAIAGWMTRYREAHAKNDLAKCDKDEVSRIAHELGMSAQDLAAISSKGPNSAALLERMLSALGVDAQAHRDAALMHDLQRLCVSCGAKQRCVHEFASGGAVKHFHDYCPNAYTLDALLAERKSATRN